VAPFHSFFSEVNKTSLPVPFFFQQHEGTSQETDLRSRAWRFLTLGDLAISSKALAVQGNCKNHK
jgi:hypothetical protein